jgi:hypothetical protein
MDSNLRSLSRKRGSRTGQLETEGCLLTLNRSCETEYQSGRAEADEAELAESGEFVRAATREFAGGEDRSSELAGQLFNACGTVDGRANAGEIPVALRGSGISGDS